MSFNSFNLSHTELAKVKSTLTNSDSQLELIAKEGLVQRSR
ncbi:hypothetical protein [Pleurocapsa sp. PCC 7319]|nr:hypothetical protein [Pleurocapsa sp. PCC 7319]